MVKGAPSAPLRSENSIEVRSASARTVRAHPNGTTSTGMRPRSRDMYLLSSTITTKRAAAAATIFSRSIAPPLPLMRCSAGSTLSAPSTSRSSRQPRAPPPPSMPCSRASSALATDVATARIVSPWRNSLRDAEDEPARRRAGSEADAHAVARPAAPLPHLPRDVRRRRPRVQRTGQDASRLLSSPASW